MTLLIPLPLNWSSATESPNFVFQTLSSFHLGSDLTCFPLCWTIPGYIKISLLIVFYVTWVVRTSVWIQDKANSGCEHCSVLQYIKKPLFYVQFFCHKLGVTEGERRDSEGYRMDECILDVISWTTRMSHCECFAFVKLYIALFSSSCKALETQMK